MAGLVPVATVLERNPGVAKVVCHGGKGSVTQPIREIGGEIFTDYYFGEANTANKSDNQTIHIENIFLIFLKTGMLQEAAWTPWWLPSSPFAYISLPVRKTLITKPFSPEAIPISV